MYLNSFDLNNHPTSINRASTSSKKTGFFVIFRLKLAFFDHTFPSGKPKNEQTSMQMVSNENLWHLSIVLAKMITLNHLSEPLEASNYNFLQLSASIRPYFDHIFASGKPQNNCTSMQMVSNVSLWCPSMILIKMVILNQ